MDLNLFWKEVMDLNLFWKEVDVVGCALQEWEVFLTECVSPETCGVCHVCQRMYCDKHTVAGFPRRRVR
jgi:hypothetical protein